MSDGIQLLPEPAEGWHWTVEEVSVDGEVFWATMQQRDPPPPSWWEPYLNEAIYTQGFGALIAILLGLQKLRSVLQRRRA